MVADGIGQDVVTSEDAIADADEMLAAEPDTADDASPLGFDLTEVESEVLVAELTSRGFEVAAG